MRIKNLNPKGWYDIPGYDGIYQINYWADIRKKLGNGKYKYLKPYVKKNKHCTDTTRCPTTCAEH